jgi:hypothetical protein
VARQDLPEKYGQDYFAPLCVGTAFMLRWCNPARRQEESTLVARQGTLHTILAAFLLDTGLAKIF